MHTKRPSLYLFSESTLGRCSAPMAEQEKTESGRCARKGGSAPSPRHASDGWNQRSSGGFASSTALC
jgi:hypothetical protein